MLLLCILILAILIEYLHTMKGYSYKDILSPTRWKHFITWLLQLALKKLNKSEQYVNRYDLIQYAYRAANCGDCLQAGKCLHCNCDIEGKFNARTDTCSEGKWGAFLSDEEMEEFLRNNELEFKVNIKGRTDVKI